ncbi:RpiB/LacA/LacB family sugar-phosphate isomerase, partial [uncultured Actinomyces sp.]
VWNEATAVLAREHNDANVIAIGARQHTMEEAAHFVNVFLATQFSGDSRHAYRIGLMSEYEKNH